MVWFGFKSRAVNFQTFQHVRLAGAVDRGSISSRDSPESLKHLGSYAFSQYSVGGTVLDDTL